MRSYFLQLKISIDVKTMKVLRRERFKSNVCQQIPFRVRESLQNRRGLPCLENEHSDNTSNMAYHLETASSNLELASVTNPP